MDHRREGLQIYQSAEDIPDRCARTLAIDGFRFWAVRELAAQRRALRDERDHFATSRRHHVEAWEDFQIPSLPHAALATFEAVGTTKSRVLGSVGRALVGLGAPLAEPLRVGRPKI